MPLPNFDSIKNIAVGKDNPNKLQVVHILKGITDHEVPPKQKHIRGIILATFSWRSSSFFYDTALKLAIYTNPVVCWKFLYVIHKLFRDGHRECINDGLRHATRVSQLQSAWSNHATKCGYPIVDFCQLITRKIRLHRKYGILPGSLELTPSELKSCLSAQLDHLFQFSVDLMDMLEETLRFKDVVFLSVEGIQAASFTPSGQCKLIPLVQCIQDAAALYELSVQVIFKLHELLGNGTMSGHRERFRDLHISVKKFFENVSHMQYFRSFVHIPSISQNPPNFCIQSELNEHTALRVTMNDKPSLPSPPTSCSLSSSTVAPVDERDSLHSGDEENSFELAIELNNVSQINSTRMSTEKQVLIKLGTESTDVNDKTDMSSKEVRMNVQDPSVNDNYHNNNTNNNLKINWNPFLDNSIQTNNHASSPYQTHVTDENHEVLIEVELLKSEIERLKAEHHEQSYSLLNRIRILEDEIKELVQYKSNHEEQQVNYETKLTEQLCQAQMFEEKFLKLKEVYAKLREEHVVLLKNYGNVQRNLQQETQQNQDLMKTIENLRHQQISSSLEKVESLPESDSQVDQSLDLQNQLNTYKSKFDSISNEKDQLTVELTLIKEKSNLNDEKLSESQQLLKNYEMKISELTNELEVLNNQFHREKLSPVKKDNISNGNIIDNHHHHNHADNNHEFTILQMNKLKKLILTNTIEQTLSVLQTNQTNRQQSDQFTEVYIHCSPTYFLNYLSQVMNHFNLFKSTLTDYLCNNESGLCNLTELIQTAFYIGQLNSELSLLSLYSKSICQSNATGDSSFECLHNVNSIVNEFTQLLNALLQFNSTNHDEDINDNKDKDNYCNQIKQHLSVIHHQLDSMSIELINLSDHVLSNDNSTVDILSSTNMIEKEMEATFDAITMAEQKFQELIMESKKMSTNHENLQVNSLILDCCSELLLSVSELVKQSQIIQKEFESSSTSVEFYKPYNRWTKGLLSAAKFVGASANVMVEIANSIVCGNDVKLERLIVISQEIAAGTTQLVYATRVKTTSSSEMFNKLQLTSKEVCKCAGNLIACVKIAMEAKDIEELDFSSLTLTQAKRKQVELQVKIIELETSLTNERQRLAQLRRDNYQLSAEVELVNDRS